MSDTEDIHEALKRTESFKERENFADAEESGDSPDIRHKLQLQAQSSAIRRRKGSRSSRTNSATERLRQSSTSPMTEDATSSDDSSKAAQDESSDQLLGSKKKRRKRKKYLDEIEKALRQKIVDIEKFLASEPKDLEKLQELATSDGGLMTDNYRRRCWPILAGIHLIESEILPTQEECEAHAQYNQVILDVNRSLKRFPPGIKDEERPGLQDQLTRLIIRVLMKHPELHYYQGYHDIAITFLLVVGEEMGYHISQKLSITHLKDFMAPTMEITTFQLNYIYPIIRKEHPDLYDFLEASEVGTIFALPWVITWFGHVLPNYEDVVRLYDFFLAKPPMMPVYLAAALVLHRDQEIMMSECDLAMVHSLLSRIPVNLPFEKLLIDAQELYYSHPPKSLETEVKHRVKRLQAWNQPRTTKSGSSVLGMSTAMGLVAIMAPIIIGLMAWKYYS